MGRRAWAWVRLLGGAVLLAALVQRLGTGPFLAGLRGVRPGTLLIGTAIGIGTTLCSAWRWRLVARALGIGLPLRAATAAYYRSQFLNCALPGGVLGDVHRGVRHGADAGDLGRGVRAVVWERTAGQLVQAALAVVVLLALPSPVQTAMPAGVTVCAVVSVVLLLAGRGLVRRGTGVLTRGLRAAAAEIRLAVLHPATWPAVLIASLLVVAGHLGMFLVAARAAGVQGAPQRLLPLALVVLLAAAIPLNVGGWGPREGAAAWVFASAGWPAGTGAAVSTVFGVMTLVSVLPGAVVLLLGWLRPRRSAGRPADVAIAAPAEPPSRTQEIGVAHG